MQTDGRTATYGRRETTLIGYAPGPNTPRPQVETDVAPPPPTIFVGGDESAADIGGEPAENPAANLAANLNGALQSPIALDDVRPLAPGDRRNPLSRRLPINRGRHLSRAFFEEGELHEQNGWEHSPLAADASLSGSARVGFTSFDRVPRRRAPMIALAVGVGMAVACAGAWAFGLWSPRGTASGDVWSALRVPGAGWQPPPARSPVAVAPAAAAVPAAVPAPAPTPLAVAAPAPVISTATVPAPLPKVAERAFAPTPDAKEATTPRARAPRILGPAVSAKGGRHAIAARRGPAARTPVARTVPQRARVKSPPAPIADTTNAPEAKTTATSTATSTSTVTATEDAASTPAVVTPVELPPASSAPAQAPPTEGAAGETP